MKLASLALISLFTYTSLSAQIIGNKEYQAHRISKAPRIDGLLNDDSWKDIPEQDDFRQLQPIENSEPSQRSSFKIAYDNSAIYVAAMFYDTQASEIKRELGSRDDELNADQFRFVIDPYNTRQDAYEFAVYASGVESDSRINDETYNCIWQSAVKVDDQGWSIELRIPYFAIRFPDKAIQEWGMQVTRRIVRNNEFDQWALTPTGVANPLAYWGTLKGIENIQPPLRLSLSPYVSGFSERAPDYADNGIDHTYSNSLSYSAGADLKYGINESFTLDMTLLPDFNQVQSDNKIKNLSRYREINYEERRPFFNEGIDLFSKGNLFYSRRIGQTPSGYYSAANGLSANEHLLENPGQSRLLNATKLSGRNKNALGIGFFNAITDNTYATIKNDSSGHTRQVLTEPLTNYNVLVLDQQLANNSSIYLINTNVLRSHKQPDANVTGTGLTLQNKKNSYAIDLSGSLSQYFSVLNDTTNLYQNQLGYKYFMGARKISGNFLFGYSYSAINDTYKPTDLGFFTLRNYRNNRMYVSYNIYKPTRFFRNTYNDFVISYSNNFVTGDRSNCEVAISNYTTLLNWWGVYGGGGFTPFISNDYNEPNVPGRYNKTLRYYYTYLGFESDGRKKLSVNGNVNLSNFIDEFTWYGYNLSLSAKYRFSNRFSAAYNWNYNYDPFNYGLCNYDSLGGIIYGGRKLYTYENVISGKYIFQKDMAITLRARHYWSTGEYVQFFLLGEHGEHLPTSYNENNDFSSNFFNVDVVYSWIFAPGSTLSIAYKNAVNQDLFGQKFNHRFDENFKATIASPQTNTLSIKLLYFLDYNSLRKKG